MFFLINFVIAFGLGVINGIASSVVESIPPVLGLLFVLVVAIPSVAVTVRRLHDTGRSGWYWFVSFIPCIGAILLIVWLVGDSEPGANQYGPNPKGE